MLQNNCIFACIHLTQEEGWHLIGKIIITHTNSFSEQQEYKSIILFNNRITVINLLCQLNTENLTEGMIRKKDQIKTSNSTPLIKDLEISNIFKNKNNKKGNGIMDKLISEVLQLLMLVELAAQQIGDIITGQA